MRLIRQVIEGTNAVIGKLRRNRTIVPAGRLDTVKINLGCGLAIAPGWINIDGSFNALISDLPRALHRVAYRLSGANRYYTEQEYCRLLSENVFVHHDLAYGIPFADASVDYAFTSHFVEHLSHSDAQNLLRECHRVLKPGGVLRVSVPDLEYAMALYGAGAKEQMLTAYFFVDDDGSGYARHKYMYDFDLMKNELLLAGFAQVTRCAYQQGAVPDLHILDNRPEESLYVEAIR